MGEPSSPLNDFLSAVAALAAVAALLWLGVKGVRYAKKGTRGAAALGSFLLLFGMGNVRDPLNETVQQTKDQRKREDGAGDPPRDDENSEE